ncbi:hypothetical protein ES702_02636 [subsurface metagenome]
MKVIQRWVSCCSIAVSIYLLVSLISSGFTPAITKVHKALSHQRREWDKVESRHHVVLESCGDLLALQNISLQDPHTIFERYQNETNVFLDIVTQRVPSALHLKNCPDFKRSSRLAISHSTSISTTLSTLVYALTDRLNEREEIYRASSSATSVFTSNARQLLRPLRSWLFQGAMPIFSLYTSGKERERIHYESGVHMLALRGCAYNLRAMDTGIVPLLKSFEQSINRLSDFVAESVASSQAWESSEDGEEALCTQRQLDAMAHHHRKTLAILLQGKQPSK